MGWHFSGMLFYQHLTWLICPLWLESIRETPLGSRLASAGMKQEGVEPGRWTGKAGSDFTWANPEMKRAWAVGPKMSAQGRRRMEKDMKVPSLVAADRMVTRCVFMNLVQATSVWVGSVRCCTYLLWDPGDISDAYRSLAEAGHIQKVPNSSGKHHVLTQW